MALRTPPRPDRAGSFLYVGLVYVLAVGAAFAVWTLAPWTPPVALFAGLFAGAAVTYAATLHADNGSVFDPWWSVLPPFAALWLGTLSEWEGVTPREVAVHAVVWFWAVRLTANWARGWPGLGHEDWRYEKLAREWPVPNWVVRGVAVVGAPTLFVALGCLPLYPALALDDGGFRALDGLALAVGLGAVALELAADEQMWSFAARKAPGELMDRGLWRLSRHPNYLGEISFWVSLWLFGVAAAPGLWWTAVGPVAMVLLFVFASIPLLDQRSAERRPGFEAYARRTPALLPRLGRGRRGPEDE